MSALAEKEAPAAAVLGGLTEDEDDELTAKVRHVQEVLTLLACPVVPKEGTPRESLVTDIREHPVSRKRKP